MDRHDALPDLRVHTCGWWGFFGSGPLIRPLGMVSLKESCLLLLPRHKHKGYFCRVFRGDFGTTEDSPDPAHRRPGRSLPAPPAYLYVGDSLNCRTVF